MGGVPPQAARGVQSFSGMWGLHSPVAGPPAALTGGMTDGGHRGRPRCCHGNGSQPSADVAAAKASDGERGQTWWVPRGVRGLRFLRGDTSHTLPVAPAEASQPCFPLATPQGTEPVPKQRTQDVSSGPLGAGLPRGRTRVLGVALDPNVYVFCRRGYSVESKSRRRCSAYEATVCGVDTNALLQAGREAGTRSVRRPDEGDLSPSWAPRPPRGPAWAHFKSQ